MSGAHLLAQWSRTQHVVSLSLGEAELHAICACATEGLALRNICLEMGVACDLELLTDSSAAKGIVMRQGAGRVKHLDIKTLWIQEREDRGELAIKKIPRLLNWSDLLTHHWTEQEGQRHLDGMALQRRSRPSLENLLPPPRGGLHLCTPCEPEPRDRRGASTVSPADALAPGTDSQMHGTNTLDAFGSR